MIKAIPSHLKTINKMVDMMLVPAKCHCKHCIERNETRLVEYDPSLAEDLNVLSILIS